MKVEDVDFWKEDEVDDEIDQLDDINKVGTNLIEESNQPAYNFDN